MFSTTSKSEQKAQIASELNALVHVCMGGAKGYADAASHVGDPSLKEHLERLSHQRIQFASELQYEVDQLGEYPSDGGTTLGDGHRLLMDALHALSLGSSMEKDASIVGACVKGDEYAWRVYQDVLAQTRWDGRDGAHSVVAKQRMSIEGACLELRSAAS
jgi:uncharacterized protein (TIGR02284 family)